MLYHIMGCGPGYYLPEVYRHITEKRHSETSGANGIGGCQQIIGTS